LVGGTWKIVAYLSPPHLVAEWSSDDRKGYDLDSEE
jgi:hypothetical protein